jgi:glycosyltransferase involved in cell wall biosynthesis
MSAPHVSVITIFLNEERFLAEAVESVRGQTFRDWELLLVDDGSTDASRDLARGYAAAEPDRIRYIDHPGHSNRGMGASRNLGLAEARGELVAFLDGDDVYLPDKLATQAALLDEHPEADMVYGATLYWFGWTGRVEDAARDRVRRQGVSPGLVLPPALTERFASDEARTPCTCGVLLRRAAALSVGGFEERFRGMYEDQAFFYKLGMHAPVLVDAGCHDKYRQHPDSHTAEMRRAGAWSGFTPSVSHEAFARWAAEYVTAAGAGPALRRRLSAQLEPYDHPVRYRVRAPLRALDSLLRRVAR